MVDERRIDETFRVVLSEETEIIENLEMDISAIYSVIQFNRGTHIHILIYTYVHAGMYENTHTHTHTHKYTHVC